MRWKKDLSIRRKVFEAQKIFEGSGLCHRFKSGSAKRKEITRATCLSDSEFCPRLEFGAGAAGMASLQGGKSPRGKNLLLMYRFPIPYEMFD